METHDVAPSLHTLVTNAILSPNVVDLPCRSLGLRMALLNLHKSSP